MASRQYSESWIASVVADSLLHIRVSLRRMHATGVVECRRNLASAELLGESTPFASCTLTAKSASFARDWHGLRRDFRRIDGHQNIDSGAGVKSGAWHTHGRSLTRLELSKRISKDSLFASLKQNERFNNDCPRILHRSPTQPSLTLWARPSRRWLS